MKQGLERAIDNLVWHEKRGAVWLVGLTDFAAVLTPPWRWWSPFSQKNAAFGSAAKQLEVQLCWSVSDRAVCILAGA